MRPTDKTRNQDLPRGQGDHSTLYVSLELSRSTWLVTSLSPNSDKMSKHTIAAGDAPKLLALLARLRGRAEQIVGGSLNVAVIQEAGIERLVSYTRRCRPFAARARLKRAAQGVRHVQNQIEQCGRF